MPELGFKRPCCDTSIQAEHKKGCLYRPEPDQPIDYTGEVMVLDAQSADPGMNPDSYQFSSHFAIRLPAGGVRTEQGNRCLKIAEEALALFIKKNNGYGEPDEDDLGARGQYADMHRKWKRIKKHLWDGEPWEGEESFEEVLMDFIGHLLLTIDFERREKIS